MVGMDGASQARYGPFLVARHDEQSEVIVAEMPDKFVTWDPVFQPSVQHVID